MSYTSHSNQRSSDWTFGGKQAIHATMKILFLLFGILLLIATFVWFSYFVPLGCGMNPTGCREEFSVWSQIGLIHFWAPFAVSVAAMVYGIKRS
ncbi:UNVERIFIED_ORG: hypothetical protein BCL66_12428 [Martelella mediterranea]